MATLSFVVKLSDKELSGLFSNIQDVNRTTNSLISLLQSAPENLCWHLAGFFKDNLNVDSHIWFDRSFTETISLYCYNNDTIFVVDLSGEESEINSADFAPNILPKIETGYWADAPENKSGIFQTISPETVTVIIPAEHLSEITSNAFWGNHIHTNFLVMAATKCHESIAREICNTLRKATWENSEGILESSLNYIDDTVTMEISEIGAKFVILL